MISSFPSFGKALCVVERINRLNRFLIKLRVHSKIGSLAFSQLMLSDPLPTLFEVRRGDAVRIFLRAQTGAQHEEVGQRGWGPVLPNNGLLGCKLKQWIWNSRDASCEFDLQESDIGGMILHSTWMFFCLPFPFSSWMKMTWAVCGLISVLISDLLYLPDLSAQFAH